jgi:hypothetical protein
MIRCGVGKSAAFVDYDSDDNLIDYTDHRREASRGGYVSGSQSISSPRSLYGTDIPRNPQIPQILEFPRVPEIPRVFQISDISQIPNPTHRAVSYGRRPSHVGTLFGDIDQQRRQQRPVFARMAGLFRRAPSCESNSGYWGDRSSQTESILYTDSDSEQGRAQSPTPTHMDSGYGCSLSGPNHGPHCDFCRGSCSQEQRPNSSTSSARIVADKGWDLQNMLLIYAAIIVLHVCLLVIHAALLIL